MEGLFHDDNGWGFYTLVVTVKSRQLDGSLICFGARIAEKHVAHARQGLQLVGQLLLDRDVVVVGAMHKGCCLFRDGLGYVRMCVA